MLIALIYLAAHLPFLAPSLEDFDSINFGLALHQYDPSHNQPHPPGYPVYVAAGSTAAVIVLSWFHPPTAIGPRRFVECCTDTILQLVPLVGAVAAAGVVIGAIEISALAGKFTLLISMISGGYLAPTLILSAVFLILLGMGMPTPAAATAPTSGTRRVMVSVQHSTKRRGPMAVGGWNHESTITAAVDPAAT